MLVTEKEFLQICLMTIPTISVYTKYLPENHLLEFIFYCWPQVFVIRYLSLANFIYLLFLAILFMIPKKIIKNYNSKPDMIDRSRMRIIFLVCSTFLITNFQV